MYAASLNPRQAVNSNQGQAQVSFEEGILSTSIDSDPATGPVWPLLLSRPILLLTATCKVAVILNSSPCADSSSRKSVLYWFHTCHRYVAIYPDNEPRFSQWGWELQGATQ